MDPRSRAAGAPLVRHWQATGATAVRTFRFPCHLKLFHDLVDPLQPHARPDLVHPILEQIIADDAPEVPGQMTNTPALSQR